MTHMDVHREILDAHSRGEPVVLATVVEAEGSTPGKVGFKMLIFPNGRTVGTIGGGSNEAKIISEAAEALRTGQSRLVALGYEGASISSDEPICGGQCKVFLEPIVPAPTLYIFGAGHIGQLLAKIGKITGFRIVVIDDREDLANKETFPDADEIMVTDFRDAAKRVKLSSISCVVVVTQGHKNDFQVLKDFSEKDLRYIGLIGSKKKVKETFESLEKEGISKTALQRIHAPIGLSIGAKTPSEIAVSIVAEIISVLREQNNLGT